MIKKFFFHSINISYIYINCNSINYYYNYLHDIISNIYNIRSINTCNIFPLFNTLNINLRLRKDTNYLNTKFLTYLNKFKHDFLLISFNMKDY